MRQIEYQQRNGMKRRGAALASPRVFRPSEAKTPSVLSVARPSFAVSCGTTMADTMAAPLPQRAARTIPRRPISRVPELASSRITENYGSEKEGNLLNITVGPLNSYSLMGSGVRSGVISLTSL